jgi:UDP-N-acetylglucosamine 2-epimerase
MIPVYEALKKNIPAADIQLVSTGQHKEMLQQVFDDFGVQPQIDLELMTQGQSLSQLSSKLFIQVESLLSREKPNLILVQGDTTTVQVVSSVAFYLGIDIGHVEAGLRSFDIRSPFPEEFNRKVVSLIANWHFAPTELSRKNLLREGIPEESILVSGNTVIDSLKKINKLTDGDSIVLPEEVRDVIREGKKLLLVTGHRRESFGGGFESICTALERLAQDFTDIAIVYPVHMNPKVRDVVQKRLSKHKRIYLIDPLPYKSFVYLMRHSYLILTDSGGIQEEGPSIGKPVLIMRNVTERPEGVEAGVNILVGTDSEKIYSEAKSFLEDKDRYTSVSEIPNPYGDGKASLYITNFIKEKYKLN